MKHIFLRDEEHSLRIVSLVILVAAGIIIARLFILQVIDHRYYQALALNTHEIYQQLHPRRGSILMQDRRSKKEYPAAVNRTYYMLYAVPRDIPTDAIVSTTNYLATLLKYMPEQQRALLEKLSKKDDPYEPIAKKVADDIVARIKQDAVPGVYYADQEYRYYPEATLASHVVGFTGFDEDGNQIGRYGIEGFWNKDLAGKGGFLAGERSALGSLISLAGRTMRQAEDGVDILLTVDRNVQFAACERLKQGYTEYQARSAALVMLDPATGAIIAMCSMPNFNPNTYSEVKDISVYNNSAVFTAYEPGSVFKPITMAIALDLGLVSPFTTFVDTGVTVVDGHEIRNALQKTYGRVTMTQVLENSINTGMIWVQQKIGQRRFKEYVEKFGFGKKTGIRLDTESTGDISSLGKKADIYGANGSFGQGFTATPLQMATAYATLANGGKMPKPYIIEEVRSASGIVQRTEPVIAETPVAAQANKLLNGMLISVVENGHGKKARLDTYYVAAKTGTAQIARGGKYTDETNHTFVGYFPASNPRFVLLVKYEAPALSWAESTAAPVFKDVAEFTLNYFGVPGDR